VTSAGQYHHGDLHRALLDAAAAEIEEVGSAAMSLRKVAARVGVTHPAARHHFGDKTGLLTALAAEGFRKLAAALEGSRTAGGHLLDLGLAYLRFAYDHRPWFEVMFRPDILHADDPDLLDAKATSAHQLNVGAEATRAGPETDVALGAWSFVHGFATLWLAGNLPAETLEDAEVGFRRAAVAFTSINTAS
jgi:AcrR family transcriptional regulator